MSDQDARNVQASVTGPAGAVRERALREELNALVDVVGAAPLVDILLERAFQMHATDIHLDPTPDGLRVRIRVDGLLHDVLELPTDLMSQVISRVKLMANMDITERRFSQDGHIANTALKHERDVRVGSGPTIHGERLVLRLMPDNRSLNRLDELGLEPEQAELVERYLLSSYGMILSVGPVGSGKSTTMYSCLEMLNAPAKSLATIEDPVERRVEGVNQIQVDPRIDFGFVEALRGVLRQDPNVMMVGEIRDKQTLEVTIQAALTGHLVLSSLHTNDAPSTITRLLDLGAQPYLIGATLLGILAQRLVRTLCPHCKKPGKLDKTAWENLVFPTKLMMPDTAYLPVGCDECRNTGYMGRTGIYESLVIDKNIRNLINTTSNLQLYLESADKQGMESLKISGAQKIVEGLTTLEEIYATVPPKKDD